MSAAEIVVVVFSVLTLGLGGYGFVHPAGLITFAAQWQSAGAIALAVVFRLIFGACLLIAAPSSRTPLAFQIFGALTLVAALAAPFLGLRRLRAWIEWWAQRPRALIRAWALVAVGLGAFLLWSVWGEEGVWAETLALEGR